MNNREIARQALFVCRHYKTPINREEELYRLGWKYLGSGSSSRAFRKKGVVVKFIYKDGDENIWNSSRKALAKIKKAMPKRIIKEYYSGVNYVVQRYERRFGFEQNFSNAITNKAFILAKRCATYRINDICFDNVSVKMHVFDATTY